MLKLEYKPYTLDFKFEAGTSRGVLRQHKVYFIKISENGLMPFGYGEAAPLPGLSVESYEDLGEKLERLTHALQDCYAPATSEEVFDLAEQLVEARFPSLRFALETALLDLIKGGKQLVFDNAFYCGVNQIKINGLVWMGDRDLMKQRIDEKLEAGYTCMKMKVGAIDWAEELQLIKYLRSKSLQLTIRLDANGGFHTREVLSKLQDLDGLDIHSIEQPVMPRQPEAMRLICSRSKVPIALDEELIDVHGYEPRKRLLTELKPAFLVLKPTLLGGFRSTRQWIDLAEGLGIGWWITSALESNIGLNAISQFTAGFQHLSYQGLGTGQLYANNIHSPLSIQSEMLFYNQTLNWDMPL